MFHECFINRRFFSRFSNEARLSERSTPSSAASSLGRWAFLWKNHEKSWAERQSMVDTLPTTNSSPLKIGKPKRKGLDRLNQPSILQGVFVSCREGSYSQHRTSASLVDQIRKDLPDKSLEISTQKKQTSLYLDAQCMEHLKSTFTTKTTI